ncbi:alkaline phosphatase family protein [Nocardioides sp.]|uniref:alkaline phosphatase family protein n=1 Tax=Nocardioides sp. TaxID=35761 RepID=UPI002ED16316
MRRIAVLVTLALAVAVTPTQPAGSVPPPAASALVLTPVTTADRGTTRGATSRPTKVVIVTLDSVGSRAIRLAGRDRAPTLHWLLRRGAGTLNARTLQEKTLTLPNHTSVVTGRRLDAAHGGHGVSWNDNRTEPATVQEAAGHAVSSVFRVVGSKKRETSLFASKEKLRLFERSWGEGINRVVIDENNRVLARKARRDLVRHRRELTFLHLSGPDNVGHDAGFLSEAHLNAVAEADRLLARLISAIKARPRLRKHVTVIVTADHGGKDGGHGNATELVNYRIPFIVWGAGVKPGADLYELNPRDYRNPRKRRTWYGAKRPPVRNGDAANLATDLLGLRALRGSQFNARQSLDVR